MTAPSAPASVIAPLGDSTSFVVESSANSRLTVSPVPLPDNASFDLGSGLFKMVPDETQVGQLFEITFTAIRGTSSKSMTTTIEVTARPAGSMTGLQGTVLKSEDESPLVGAAVSIPNGGPSTVTDAQGEFELIGVAHDAPSVHIDGFGVPNGPYAFVAEDIELLLEHPIYEGQRNVVNRPVFLPFLGNPVGTVTAGSATMLTCQTSMGMVQLEIAADAATMDGAPFAGDMFLVEVDRERTPASLPGGLEPGLVLAIQPAGILFSPPARISFPNYDGLADGSETDIWSINPDTGLFDIACTGIVSGDRIESAPGCGVNGASWHFPLPPAVNPDGSGNNGQSSGMGDCVDTGPHTFLATGALSITHELVSYRSLGKERVLQLVYNSTSADPRPILLFDSTIPTVSAVPDAVSLGIDVGGVDQGIQVYTSTNSLSESQDETFHQAIQFDARSFETGRYQYDLSLTSHFTSSSVTGVSSGGAIVQNRMNSPIGSGWGIASVQELILDENGNALIVDGNGESVFFASVPADLPVTYFPLDGNANDASGNERHGTLFGDTTLVPDRFGRPNGAYEFDGSGDYIQASSTGLPTADRTIAFWFRANQVSNRPVLFSYGGGGGCGTSWFMGLNMGPSIFGNRYALTAHCNVHNLVHPYQEAPVGKWMHWAISTAPSGSTMYLNGIPVASNSTFVNNTSVSGRHLSLGVATSPSGFAPYTDGNVSYYNGALDDVRIYDRALTPKEIAELFVGIGENVFVAPLGERTSLAAHDDGTFTRSFPNGSKVIFDSTGRQSATVDTNGNVTAYSYEDDRLETITHPLGNVTTLTYERGLLRRITDPVGRVTRFEHAGTDLTAVVDPDGGRRAFSYSDRHLLQRETSKRGLVTTYKYDAAGRHGTSVLPDGSSRRMSPSHVVGLVDVGSGVGTTTNPAPIVRPAEAETRLVDGNGGVTRYTTDRFGRVTTVIDSLGRVTRTERDDDGNAIRIVHPDGRTDEMEYDLRGSRISLREAVGVQDLERISRWQYHPVLGFVVEATDFAENQTSFEYDDAGNLLRVTDPLGNNRTFTYDDRGLLEASTDENGNAIRRTYDMEGRLEAITDATGVVTRIRRDAAGNVLEVREGVGTAAERLRSFSYDVMNRVTTMTDGAGGVTTLTYDKAGNLATTTLPTGERILREYDSLNRLSRVIDPVRGTTRLTYDLAGNLLTERDALGRTKTFAYDKRGNVIQSIDANGGTQQYAYDEFDRMVELENANGHSTSIDYDALHRRVELRTPDGRKHAWEYDALDNVRFETKPGGVRIEHRYDALSRLRETIAPAVGDAPANTVSYSYDSVGNVIAVSDNDTALEFNYDANNRRLQARTLPGGTQPIVTLTSTYDAAGNRLALADTMGGSYSYGYDGAGRLTFAEAPSGAEITIGYDPSGRQRLVTFPNGHVGRSSYEMGTGRLSRITHGQGQSSPILELTYRLNAAGRIASITDGNHLWNYTYDKLDRLTSASAPNGGESYSYDPVGNRLTSHLSGEHVHNGDNQLSGDDEYSYTYDARGNLSSRTLKATSATTRYVFDAQDQLVEVRFPDGSTAEYRYDGLGRRVSKTLPGGTSRKYIYDGNNILLEFDSASKLLARYTHGNQVDQHLAMTRDGADYFYHTDHLGSVRRVTDSSGVVVNSYDYDSYGQVLASPWMPTEGVENPFWYTGREEAREVESYFYRARWYDPRTGRFQSEDPIGFGSGDVNWYRYVSNDPVSLTDPSGLGTFHKRPLKNGKIPTDYTSGGFCDFFNIERLHEQYFFDDGTNLGFGLDLEGGGVLGPNFRISEPTADRKEELENYHWWDTTHYDDELIRDAIAIVGASPYLIVGSNCQDWADRVREVYRRLATCGEHPTPELSAL